MKKFYSIVFLLNFVFAFGQSNYVAENFDYTATQALTDNSWIAHSGGTTNPVSVSDGGLTWTGYIGSGVGNAALVNNTGQDVNKPFGANINSGVVYASFLMKVNANTPAGYFFHFGYASNQTTPVFTSLSTAFRARTHVAPGTDTATQFKLGLSFNANDPQGLTEDLTIGETYLVVVKYKFIDEADNDEVSIFVFASGDTITTEPATPTLGPFTGSAADAPVIQTIALRQYNATQNITVDGIYVRTEWNLTDAGIPLSTDDFAVSQTKIYPNPVNNGTLHIITPSKELKKISIFDISGRSVFKQTTENNTINVSHIKTGLYLLNITINGSKKTSKIIIN